MTNNTTPPAADQERILRTAAMWFRQKQCEVINGNSVRATQSWEDYMDAEAHLDYANELYTCPYVASSVYQDCDDDYRCNICNGHASYHTY